MGFSPWDLCIFAPMKFTSAIIIVLGFLVPLQAQESLAEIRRSMKSVEQETSREKDLAATESKRHAAYVETSRQKVAALAQQESALRGQLDSMRAEIARLRDAKQKTAGGARYYEARKARYAEELARLIDSVAPRLESDFPYKNEDAVSSLRETSAQLRKGVVTPDEALGRVLELLLDRIRLGYTTETWSGYLAWQGRSIPGKFLRYGAVASVFVGQNGEDILWLARDGKNYQWMSAGQNLELRATLKDVMKVAEGKTPPKLVNLPIPTSRALQGDAK